MKKIYVKGYYGFKNLGDDIFFLVSQYIFKTYLKNFEPIYIGVNLPKTDVKFKVYIPKSQLKRRLLEMKIIFSVDYILYFGGSLFSSGGDNFKDIKYIFKKFKRFKNKLISFGISVGPFENDENFQSTKKLFERFLYLGVRDKKSINYLEEMKINNQFALSFDNAILLRQMFPSLIKNTPFNANRKVIGISLCKRESYENGDFSKEEQRILSIENTLLQLIQINSDLELKFFVFNGSEQKGDLEITKEFYQKFSKLVECEIYDYNLDTKTFLEKFTKVDFVFGVRLHSAVIAYTFDIPFILVEYHSKCTEFLETINYDSKYDLENPGENAKKIDFMMRNPSISDNIVKPGHYLDIIEEELIHLEKCLADGVE